MRCYKDEGLIGEECSCECFCNKRGICVIPIREFKRNYHYRYEKHFKTELLFSI